MDIQGLESKWVTDPTNPVTEMPDGSKVINLVWLVDKWFGEDYLDYGKRDTRDFGTNYWDHRLWKKLDDGTWTATSGNRFIVEAATIAEEKYHLSTHAKIGTVAMGGSSALLAAPVAGLYGAGTAVSSAYLSTSTFVSNNLIQLGAAGAAAQQAYNRVGPALTRISHSPTLHIIASDGTLNPGIRPGSLGGWFQFYRGSVLNPVPFFNGVSRVGDDLADLARRDAINDMVAEGWMPLAPLHHLATNKHLTKWTPLLEPLFVKAGYGLDDVVNKVRVPGHSGPHPDEYHEAVYSRLRDATRGLSGHSYRDAFNLELSRIRAEATTVGEWLNTLITKSQ